MRSIVIGLATIAGAAALATVVAANPPPPPPAEDAPRKLVRVALAEEAQRPNAHRYAGQVRAKRRAELAPTIGARLRSRPVEVGDTIEAGTVVARLDARQFRNAQASSRGQLDALRAQLELANKDLGRAHRLNVQGSLADARLDARVASVDDLRARSRATEAAMAENRRLVLEAVLRAPFDAVVTAVHFEPKEFVPPGQPVVGLTGTGGLEIEIEVGARLRGALTVGQPAHVVLPLAGLQVQGTVAVFADASRGGGHLFAVRIDLPRDPSVTAGMAAEVVVETAPTSAISVPIAAVVAPGSAGPQVLTVVDGTVQRAAVEVVGIDHDNAFVRPRAATALPPGSAVVIGGHSALVAGQSVEVAP